MADPTDAGGSVPEIGDQRWLRIIRPEGSPEEVQTSRRTYLRHRNNTVDILNVAGILPIATQPYWKDVLTTLYPSAQLILYPDMKYCGDHYQLLSKIRNNRTCSLIPHLYFGLDADVEGYERLAKISFINQGLRYMDRQVHQFFVPKETEGVDHKKDERKAFLRKVLSKLFPPIWETHSVAKQPIQAKKSFQVIYSRDRFVEEHFSDILQQWKDGEPDSKRFLQKDPDPDHPPSQETSDGMDQWRKTITGGIESILGTRNHISFPVGPVLERFRYEESIRLRTAIWAFFANIGGNERRMGVLFDPTRLHHLEQFLDNQEFSVAKDRVGREEVSWYTAFTLPLTSNGSRKPLRYS